MYVCVFVVFWGAPRARAIGMKALLTKKEEREKQRETKRNKNIQIIKDFQGPFGTNVSKEIKNI